MRTTCEASKVCTLQGKTTRSARSATDQDIAIVAGSIDDDDVVAIESINRLGEGFLVRCAHQVYALRAKAARDRRRMPLIGRPLRISIHDGGRVTVLGELARQDDCDGGLAASAFRVRYSEDAWQKVPPSAISMAMDAATNIQHSEHMAIPALYHSGSPRSRS